MEWNMSNNLLKYLYGERDTMEVQKDMEKVGVQQHLWLRRRPRATNFFKPTTPFGFTQDENKSFLDFVTSIHAPIGYLATFNKHVDPKRLFSMKSHDHHVMVQQILPLAMHNLLQLGPKATII
jgi:hypothetical protein